MHNVLVDDSFKIVITELEGHIVVETGTTELVGTNALLAKHLVVGQVLDAEGLATRVALDFVRIEHFQDNRAGVTIAGLAVVFAHFTLFFSIDLMKMM